jgi:predicted nucleotidyltransferase component of viral defense system
LSTPADPYHEQLRLLVQLLSFVRREDCFALKGGTAINLFYRDLPRYSVDIDLTYLPGETYAHAQKPSTRR